MVRDYLDEPLPAGAADQVLAAALRAPSAGFSQGWGFIALEDAGDRERFWEHVPGVAPSLCRAPLIVVCCSHKAAYLERYAEPDKGWTDRDETRWPAPYWDIDTGMAALLMLMQAVDLGLGACFFGVQPERHDGLRAAFGIPPELVPIGAISAGRRAEEAPVRGSGRPERRRPAGDVIHRGRW